MYKNVWYKVGVNRIDFSNNQTNPYYERLSSIEFNKVEKEDGIYLSIIINGEEYPIVKGIQNNKSNTTRCLTITSEMETNISVLEKNESPDTNNIVSIWLTTDANIYKLSTCIEVKVSYHQGVDLKNFLSSTFTYTEEVSKSIKERINNIVLEDLLVKKS